MVGSCDRAIRVNMAARQPDSLYFIPKVHPKVVAKFLVLTGEYYVCNSCLVSAVLGNNLDLGFCLCKVSYRKCATLGELKFGQAFKPSLVFR